MKIRIKKRMMTTYLINENQEIIAVIKDRNAYSIIKDVFDQNHKLIFKTDIINSENFEQLRQYRIYSDYDIYAEATLEADPNDQSKSLSYNTSKINRMNIKTKTNTYVVDRKNIQTFRISCDSTSMGIITLPSLLDYAEIEIYSDINPFFIAAITVLVNYMSHENDIPMV